MSKIALLVPDESMLRQAHDALQEMKTQLHIMRVIRTSEAVSEARKAVNEGADIIIARGIQATLIRQYTDLPVVEIVMTVQSAKRLLERAKRITGTERPAAAFVMLRNMACPMAGLGDKLGVDLREYYVQNLEMLRDSAVQAIEDRADILIGGAAVLEIADQAGVPSLFLSTDETAMANAIREAARLGEALERDTEGKGKGQNGAREISSRGRKAGKEDAEPFVNFAYQSEKMRECVELASLLSASGSPKLIIEENGSLKKAFAAAIHNHSAHAGDRMVQYDCAEERDSYEDLFGRKGIFTEAGKSTVLLENIENLGMRAQKHLPEMLLFRHVIMTTSCPDPQQFLLPELWYRLSAFVIRIPSLRETPEDIPLLMEGCLKSICERLGKFLVLEKAAKEWIAAQNWPGNRLQLESFLERLVICAERRIIREERVRILYAELYGFGAPEKNGGHSLQRRSGTEEGITEEENRERERILDVLAENLGNREKSAAQLGISTTTLWRKLKKLRIL